MRIAQSDRILNLLGEAEQVETAIVAHVDEITQRLDAWAAELPGIVGEGEPPPDFRTVLLTLKAGLSDSREKLSAAEQYNIGLLRRAVELRQERSTLNQGLYEDFSSLRRTLEELYRGKGKRNPQTFVMAGFQGPTGKRSQRLLRQVDVAIRHLGQPGLTFPASRFATAQLTPQQLIDAIQPGADQLRATLAALQQLSSELNASRKEKGRALQLLRGHLSAVSKAAAGFFQLAGEKELARRIRPKRRSPSRPTTEETQSTDETPETEAPQGTEATESAEGAASEESNDSAAEPSTDSTPDTSADPAPAVTP